LLFRSWDTPSNFGIKEAANALDILKNGGNATIPIYSFRKRKRLGNKKVSPRSIIIFEGLYAGFEDISEVLDLLIYVEAPLYIRLIRRIFRNSFERYKSEPSSVLKHLISGGVFPAHRDLVITQSEKAHYIIRITNKLSEILSKYGFINKVEINHLIKIVAVFQLEDEVCIRIMEDEKYALYFTIYNSENCYFIMSLDLETFNLFMQLNLFEL
jgi:uridine kinase